MASSEELSLHEDFFFFLLEITFTFLIDNFTLGALGMRGAFQFWRLCTVIQCLNMHT